MDPNEWATNLDIDPISLLGVTNWSIPKTLFGYSVSVEIDGPIPYTITKCNCDICTGSFTPIDQLLEDIDTLENYDTVEFGNIQTCRQMESIPRAKLALDVMSKGMGFRFKMLMEQWNIQQLVQELY